MLILPIIVEQHVVARIGQIEHLAQDGHFYLLPCRELGWTWAAGPPPDRIGAGFLNEPGYLTSEYFIIKLLATNGNDIIFFINNIKKSAFESNPENFHTRFGADNDTHSPEGRNPGRRRPGNPIGSLLTRLETAP